MSVKLQKLTSIMLVLILAATPMRAARAAEITQGELSTPHIMNMQMQMNEPENTDCCCSDDQCFMHGCEHCNSVTPGLLVFRVPLVEAHHQLNYTAYLKIMNHRHSPPLLHPPRA